MTPAGDEGPRRDALASRGATAARRGGLPRDAPPRRGGFKMLRITILLLVLLVVALTTWQDRYLTTRWHEPLYVAIYPIAADDSAVTSRYLAGLDAARF